MNANVLALPAEKQVFLKTVLGIAQGLRHVYGMPASVVTAQCLLESAWGKSDKARMARNYFGIKAGSDWAGPVLLLPTKEFIADHWIVVSARWRKYDSLNESMEDHARFLQHPNYASCFAYKNDFSAFCKELQKCGYATDPEYASQLIATVECYDLQSFDFRVA